MSVRVKIMLFGALAAIAGFIALILGQKSEMRKLATALQEQYHTTAITDAKAKADVLMKSADVDQAKIDALQVEIEARKAKLTQAYTNAGMTNADVLARLAALKL